MSLQRHFKRDEVWFVSNGECKVKFKAKGMQDFKDFHLKLHDVFKVSKEDYIKYIILFNKSVGLLKYNMVKKLMKMTLKG